MAVLATVRRRPFACHACGEGAFEYEVFTPNTSTAELFGYAWLNRPADCLICRTCGYLHWFLSAYDEEPAMEMWEEEGGYPESGPEADSA